MQGYSGAIDYLLYLFKTQLVFVYILVENH